MPIKKKKPAPKSSSKTSAKTSSRTPAKSARKTSTKTSAKSAPRTSAKGATKKPLKKKGSFTPRNKTARKGPPKKKPVAPKAPTSPVKENPEAKALATRIAQLLLEKKASNVVVLDVRGKTSYADYIVVASGESDTQVAAMAENVTTTLKREGGHQTVGTEGQQGGNWVLVDYGDVVTHLFLEDTRAFYDLEGLWADARKEHVA